jgi:hypothetical protein
MIALHDITVRIGEATLVETVSAAVQGDCMLKISPERWGLSCHFLPFVPECA